MLYFIKFEYTTIRWTEIDALFLQVVYNEKQVIQQNGDCWEVVSDRGDRHCFTFFTCSFRVEIVFESISFQTH